MTKISKKTKILNANATLTFKEDFSETIQEMIEEGELKTVEEIKDYILSCIAEDINDLSNNYCRIEHLVEFEIEF